MNLNVIPAGNIPVIQGNSNIALYKHQEDACTKLVNWTNTATEDPAGLLVLPTGGGKTLTATYWLMQNILSQGKKILWIAHTYSLLEQAYHSFEMVCYKNIAIGGKNSYSYRIVSGMHCSAYSISPDDDIVIASKASLSVNKPAFREWLEKNRDNFYFIIDEAHHAPALGYRNLIDDMRKYGGKFFMLGLTATPFRTDEEEIGGWMKKVFPDDILYRISISDLISREILSQPHFERKNTDLDMKKLFEDNNATDVYNRIIHNKKFDIGGVGKDAKRAAALIAKHHERNAFIVETYKNNAAKYGKTLVFALNQAMAKVLYEYFQAAGVRVGCVISSYGSYANEQTIKKFKNDEIDVLVNVNIVTEGVDVPNVQTVFLTRPTKSKILMTQMIGRGLRGKKVGGTEITYIVDFLDNWRDDLVAWVIPEKLYAEEAKILDEEILEIYDDIDLKKLSDLEILHAISEGQLAEFIRLANSKFDLSLFKEFSLIERIPLGYYYFDYEVSGDDREGEVKTCTVLVYDCMKAKFDELFDWLKNRADKKFFDIGIDAAADEIDEKFFGVREELLAYDKENICDILRFYVQNDCNLLPQFVEFDKRAEYDLSPLVQQVADKDFIETMKIIENAWSTDDKWKQLFGENNQTAFINAVMAEIAKKAGIIEKPTNELTDEEIKTAENVQLDVLVVRHPEIYEKIRDAVYEKFSDETDYFDEQKSNRSKYRLDFEIEYKTTLSSGGKTSPDNLKLVYKGSSLSNLAYKNMPLSEIKQKDSVLYKKICDAVYRNYQLRDGKYFDGQTSSKRSDDKNDFEIDYIKPLDKGGTTKTDNLHLVYKGSVTTTTTTSPPVLIPDTNLTWQLDDNTGTLTISGNGNMKDFPPNAFIIARGKRDLIKKVIIEEGVTSIGSRAFEYCYSLQSVEFSKSVTEIAKEAFFYCKNLEEINLPINLITIGERAFRGCYYLEKVNFQSNVQQIGDEAFSACPWLDNITLPQSLQKIGNNVFDGCKNLKEIKYPRGLKDAYKLSNGNSANLIPY